MILFLVFKMLCDCFKFLIYTFFPKVPKEVQEDLRHDRKVWLEKWQEQNRPKAPQQLHDDVLKAFNYADKNGDGEIDRDEVEEMIRELGRLNAEHDWSHALSDPSTLNMIMGELDVTGDNVVSFNEALTGIMRLRSDVIIRKAFGLEKDPLLSADTSDSETDSSSDDEGGGGHHGGGGGGSGTRRVTHGGGSTASLLRRINTERSMVRGRRKSVAATHVYTKKELAESPGHRSPQASSSWLGLHCS